MFPGSQRRRKLSAISFLFVLAVCAAFAAHERLHDLELAEAGHASDHHDGVVHSHPGVATANTTVENRLLQVDVVVVRTYESSLTACFTSPSLLRPGPHIVDDVGLHDLLSVYRI
jgi:hypothetical protein